MNEKRQVEHDPPKVKKEFSPTRRRRPTQNKTSKPRKKTEGQKTDAKVKVLKSKVKDKRKAPSKKPNQKKKNARPKIDIKNPIKWKRMRTLVFWILIFMGALTLSSIFGSKNDSRAEVPYSDFKKMVESEQVESGTVEGIEFKGTLKDDVYRNDARGRETNKIHVVLPNRDAETFQNWDFQFEFKEQSIDWVAMILSSWPILLLIGFWIFMMRRMQGGVGGGGKGIFSFAKSPAQRIDQDKAKITFKDVAGCEEAKKELQEVVAFLKNPKRFERLGGKIPRGVLLVGAPGTGKTLLARAVSGEAGVPYFSLSGADFVEMFVGVGAARVRDLFLEGKKHAPCIVFIDEIDAVGRHRFSGIGGGHDEREQTLNQLLVELDGFSGSEKLIVIAATNRPDVLDKALLRPGRFDRRVVVDLPDVRGREAILKVHARQVKMSKKVDFKIIAKSTPGLSGADLANLINEAALLAARRRAEYVDMRDFENAKDKVMMGIERKSMVISDKEKEITAYHEAGHALVATLLPDADPIHKVTIIPRGMALGLTHQLPIDERHNYPRSYIVTQIKILLGGRIAEKVVFDELTTGGGNDIERATEIARKMVTKWGMSDVIGPMTFEENSEEIFLGRDISRQKNISDETAKIIDREVAKIIRSAEREVTALLKANIELLKSLFKALLSKETLNNREIQEIVNKSSKQAPAVKKEKQRETNKKKVSEKIRKKPTRIKTQKSQKSDKKQGQSPGKKADSEMLVLPKPSDERPTIQADSKTEEKNIEKSQEAPSQSGIIFVESAEEKNKNKEKKS